jgi:ketosteroid isomerase-like protein
MATDEEQILMLVGQHSQLTDDGDYERRIGLYAEDGEFIMGDNPAAKGHEQLRATFAASSSPERRGKHITANSVITVTGDTAEGQTDFIFAHLTDAGMQLLAAGRYYDTFAKVGGEWRYTRRQITFLGA